MTLLALDTTGRQGLLAAELLLHGPRVRDSARIPWVPWKGLGRAKVKVKAGTPFFLLITNKDAVAIEFESKELRVVPPDVTVKVRMRAPTPGSYPFVDDFHHETTGRIVAE